LAEYAQTVVAQFPALEVWRESRLTGLRLSPEAGHLKSHATCRHQGQDRLIHAKIVIDSSGDAVAGALAGATTEAPPAEELQNATLIFRVTGADPNALGGYSRLKLSAAIARGATRGELPAGCDSVLVRPGEQVGEAYISLNLPKWRKREYAPLEEAFMQDYTQHARRLGENLIAFLRDRLPGWSQCRLLEWPQKIGVRETRHMLGHYVMQEADILRAASFPDAVARSSWPVELWQGHKGANFKYPTGVAEIPLRALISRSFANLGMAGRCMSGSHLALGALRVLGTAMATGEAIGLAAALAIEANSSLLAVSANAINERRNHLMEVVLPKS
jgi:hypothetical protein